MAAHQVKGLGQGREINERPPSESSWLRPMNAIDAQKGVTVELKNATEPPRGALSSQEEYAAAALNRGLSAMDRYESGVDRDRSAGNRAEVMGLPRDYLRQLLDDHAPLPDFRTSAVLPGFR